MTITLSCSMKVYDQAAVAAAELEKAGHTVLLPTSVTPAEPQADQVDWSTLKRGHIEDHLEKLRRSDALLAFNPRQGSDFGRIGASTFFEIGWAYALGKQIFVLEPLDPSSPLTEDILAIQATQLHGSLNLNDAHGGNL